MQACPRQRGVENQSLHQSKICRLVQDREKLKTSLSIRVNMQASPRQRGVENQSLYQSKICRLVQDREELKTSLSIRVKYVGLSKLERSSTSVPLTEPAHGRRFLHLRVALQQPKYCRYDKDSPLSRLGLPPRTSRCDLPTACLPDLTPPSSSVGVMKSVAMEDVFVVFREWPERCQKCV